MRIHATINEQTLRRTFREHLNGKRTLTVLDNDLPGFALRVSPKGTRTFFVRGAPTRGVAETVLGTAEELTAAQAREKSAALIEGFTGIDGAYEAPESPDMEIDTTDIRPDLAVQRIFVKLESLGLIR